MQLDEHQRNAILREMGIQTYVSRRPLPGARASAVVRALAQSPVVQQPSDAALSVAMQTRVVARTLAEPVVLADEPAQDRSLPEALAERGAAVAPSVESARMTSAAAIPVVPAEPARFAFAYIPVNEQLAVINELPWARSATLSPSCRQLLADMLKAIGAPCDADTLSPMVFTWPLPDAGDMPVDAESARHMLEGFVSRRLKLRPVPYLLVLAEDAARFLFPAHSAWQVNANALQSHPRFPVELVITHSLNVLEAVRELKRPAWAALQPLKQALDRPAQHNVAAD